MKIYAYILIVLSGVLTAQCSKVTLMKSVATLRSRRRKRGRRRKR